MPERDPILPHGGVLVDLLVPRAEVEGLAREARHYPKVVVSQRELSDLELLTVGALSPLRGFQGEEAYRSVLETMRLPDGLPWTIPVTLSLTREEVKRVGRADAVALTSREGGHPVAVVEVEGIFRRDREREALGVFGTTDLAHPGVRALHEAGDYCLAGPVRALRLPHHRDFQRYRLTPAETREEFRRRGWRRVVGFQTRNPIHRAHEYIQKCALEIADGLLVHPLMGATKADDVPPEVRMRCYEVLFEHYYPKDRALIAVFPAAMRYAGPKEAVWHAICRKNYGCTHFIVGRDHAGVGDYYGPYDAQRIFEAFEPGELGITPLMFEHAFWCNRCEGMATPKTCPHDDRDRLILSGTRVREMLRAGRRPPPEFSRPEVAEVLIQAMRAPPG